MAPSKYEVRSLYANVGCGDAAIHCLFEDEYTIVSAVLIDGGSNMSKTIDTGDGYQKNPIIRMLAWINAQGYKFLEDADRTITYDCLKFSTIIITHWDEDHYNGLVSALQLGYTERANTPPISWLKWAPDNKTPRTALYCPNVSSYRGSMVSNKDKRNGPHEKLFALEDDETIIAFKIAKIKKYINFATFSHAELDRFAVLGVDFFSNNKMPPSPTRPTDRYTATQMMDENKPRPYKDTGEYPDRPGMYGVGVLRRSLFPPQPNDPGYRPYGLSNQASKDTVFDGPNVGVVADENVTMTNKISIAACILWNMPGFDPPIRCSHYFAGDADERSEQQFAIWLAGSGIKTITSMKLSHHGSKSSTPLNMLTQFKPLNVIASSPFNKYFHPAWETIVNFAVCANMYSSRERAPILFATKYPFFLKTEFKNQQRMYPFADEMSGKKNRFNEDSFKENAAQPFRDFVKANSQNVINDFSTSNCKSEMDVWAVIEHSPPLERRGKLLDLIAGRWKEHCWPDDSSAESFDFLLIYSHNSAEKDGAVYFKRLYQNTLEAYRATKFIEPEPDQGFQTQLAQHFGEDLYNQCMPPKDLYGNIDWQIFYDGIHHLIAIEQSQAAIQGTNSGEYGSMQEEQQGQSASLTGMPLFPEQPGPVLPEPGDGETPPGGPESDGWYLYASGVNEEDIKKVADINRSKGYLRLEKDSPNWDHFISKLHTSVITLTEKPGENSLKLDAELHSNDELSYWLRLSIGIKKVWFLRNANYGKEGEFIGGFRFIMEVKRQGGTPVELSFSTDADNMARQFGFDDVKALKDAGMGDAGLRKTATALVFALEPLGPPQMPPTISDETLLTLSDLATFVGLDNFFSQRLWMEAFGLLPLEFPTQAAEKKDAGDDTGPGPRNAVWLIPDMSYKTITRLQLDLSKAAHDGIRELLGVLGKSFKLTKCTAIARKESTWKPPRGKGKGYRAATKGKLTLLADITIAEDYTFHTVINFEEDAVRLSLTLGFRARKAIDHLFAWLQEVTGVKAEDLGLFSSWLNQKPSGFKSVDWEFQRISLEFAPASKDSKELKFSHVAFDIELLFNIENDKSNTVPLLFLVRYSYTPQAGVGFLKASALEADLWIAPSLDWKSKEFWILPDYEIYDELDPKTTNSLPGPLNLRDFSGLESLPAWAPTTVSRVQLYLSGNGVAFGLCMKAHEPIGDEKVPIFEIASIDLNFAYQFGEGGGLAASMDILALLQPPKTAQGEPAQLEGIVQYSKTDGWKLSASVKDLTGACVAQFFEQEYRGTVCSLLESITIKEFTIEYAYPKGQDASSLLVTGSLLVGKFALDIKYEHTGTKKWCFMAIASSASPAKSCTVGEIIEDITGSKSELPDFVKEISIAFNPAQDRIGLRMLSTETVQGRLTASQENMMLLTVFFQVGAFLTQYIQLRPVKAGSGTKRMFVTALQALPKFELPLLGNVSEIFDEVLFVWVQNEGGITKSELDTINGVLGMDGIKGIPFKPEKKETKPEECVITKGLHLMLVVKDNKGEKVCVLDYRFGKDEKKRKMKLLGGSNNEKQLFEAEEPAKSSGMASYPKKVGPLTISNAGFDFTNKVLSVKVDARVKIGPMEFELVGLQLGMDFKKEPEATLDDSKPQPWSLHNLPRPEPSLKGLMISYDKKPLQISGLLTYEEDEHIRMFQGALVAGLDPWQFAAAGCYGQVKDVAYTTAFLFCMVQGPLFTLTYAEISGLKGGFGYNSHLRLPVVEEIPKFPLIGSNSNYSSPIEAQSALFTAPEHWISPQKDSFWVAAGLTVKAFKMLTIDALIVVEWDPSVKLGLFGIASAVIPFSKTGVQFGFVELGISAIIDFDAGTMQLAGQLTPASFIIHPNCHLTGGFAMYSWFGGPSSSHKDTDAEVPNGWVFTIGGYHAAFKAPSQYPNPPRLGISWDMGPVSVRGTAYFAITPAVCMGGGTWNVSLTLGSLQAFYTAYIDFLINFQPFHFIADGGLAVGVRYSMDLWLVTLHISVDIAARLHLEGPPVRGVVHVDFWVFGFDVAFGDESRTEVKPLPLSEFIDLVCQTGQQASGFVETITARTSLKELEASRIQEEHDASSDGKDAFLLSVDDGLVSSSGTDTETVGEKGWVVRASTFTFTVSCKFALKGAKVLTPNVNYPDDPTERPVDGAGEVNARPMCLPKSFSKSDLKVTIVQLATHVKTFEHENADPVWENNTGIIKSLPSGLWGPYDVYSDPSRTANSNNLLDGTRKDASVDLLCGVRISRPKDLPATERMPQFSYKEFMITAVQPIRLFPSLEPEAARFLPGKPDIPPVDEHGRPERPSDQWDWVREKWEEPEMEQGVSAKIFVDAWRDIALEVMGWDTSKLTLRKDGLSSLIADRPRKLIDDLENRYMWGPLISAAA
ncbi:hypothetical protein G7046_g951 [Stylonectria norvegica]|nr:hypothetical protein G7046_g951 [Stylonectria norvegica]